MSECKIYRAYDLSTVPTVEVELAAEKPRKRGRRGRSAEALARIAAKKEERRQQREAA